MYAALDGGAAQRPQKNRRRRNGAEQLWQKGSAKKDAHKYDYFLVLDFEATCDTGTRGLNYRHEIIEFPVIVVDGTTFKPVDKFHRYVRPVLNPVLTPFCMKLTGIKQKDVAAASVLDDVLVELHQWLEQGGYLDPGVRFIFCTDGPWDFRDFFWKHSHEDQRCVSARYDYLYKWLDVRKFFEQVHGWSSRIIAMLRHQGMSFEGRQHCGLDDTRNIARILSRLLAEGNVPEQISSLESEVVDAYWVERTAKIDTLATASDMPSESDTGPHPVSAEVVLRGAEQTRRRRADGKSVDGGSHVDTVSVDVT
eukprot:Rhum_TRINITY_DN13964_c0_g1::Rhum_TRINITY_DN13964_c0_g1_i2::g.66327::m.66327/K18416/THEX1, ERI1; 3'-5' exoribonuclease 1